MKKLLPILFAIAIVSTASNCKKETPVKPVVTPSGTLNMNFKAIYANKPVIVGQKLDYNGKKIIFSRLQFFIAYDNLALEKPVGEVLSQTSLVKFNDSTDSATAAAGTSVEFPMAVGTFSSINFALGVPKIQNATPPKDFRVPDPLADGDNYWGSWQSYIFTKFDGKMDKDGDGIFETNFTLHTGGTEAFTPIKFAKNYTILDGKTTTVNFEINVNEWIKGIDLATVNLSHNVGDVGIMRIITGNLPTALTVK